METQIQTLIQNYGYLAVFIGTFLEGETILLLGGFAAHRGYLDPVWVIGTAFIGSFAGDQLYFYLGRRYGAAILAKRPRWTPEVERARLLIERYHSPLILGIRFMIGLRTLGPFVMGMSGLSGWRFSGLNAVGAALWAVIVGGAGYLLGEALTALLGKIEHVELEILGAIALAGAAAWLFTLYRRSRSARDTGARP